jgi:hypothetical protein
MPATSAGSRSLVNWTRQGVGQRGLADPGHVVDQQVAAGQQAGEGEADLLVLPHHDLADLARGGMQLFKHEWLFLAGSWRMVD